MTPNFPIVLLNNSDVEPKLTPYTRDQETTFSIVDLNKNEDYHSI
jgi:hypothetical protein